MPHRLLHAGIISLGDLPRTFLNCAQVLINGRTFNNPMRQEGALSAPKHAGNVSGMSGNHWSDFREPVCGLVPDCRLAARNL